MKKLLTLGLLLLLAACKAHKADHTATGSTAAFEIIKQQAYGGRETNSTAIITSQQQLDGLYNERGWSDVPKVDFDKHNVVALFMGEKNTGGYSIGIEKVTIEDDTATVISRETKPNGGNVTMAITSPYCIALIPKTKKITVEQDMVN